MSRQAPKIKKPLQEQTLGQCFSGHMIIVRYIWTFFTTASMSKDPKPLKRKVTGTRPATTTTSNTPRRTNYKVQPSFPLLFTRENYMYIGIGCGLIALGLILMMGGKMQDPNVWDESVIYSARRTVLAPIVILAGLAMQIYAIFKR